MLFFIQYTVSGVGVCALSLYNLTAECKQEEVTETKASIVHQLSLEETIEKARDVVQRAKVGCFFST